MNRVQFAAPYHFDDAAEYGHGGHLRNLSPILYLLRKRWYDWHRTLRKGTKMMVLTQEEIRAMITPVVQRHPVKRVVVFGSYARGTATAESDLDIMIDSENKLEGFDYFGIVGTLMKKFPISVDVLEASEIDKNSVFYKNILRDGVIIYES